MEIVDTQVDDLDYYDDGEEEEDKKGVADYTLRRSYRRTQYVVRDSWSMVVGDHI